MKRIDKKGFTLIELLAVIVVLAIILVITVPTVLNTLGSTRQDALNASAASVAKYYEKQIGMYLLGKKQDKFLVDIKLDNLTGKVLGQTERSISVEEADILGLNDDYSINQSCTGTSSLSSACNDTTYSTVSWNTEGEVTVKLVGASGGKFMNGSTPLTSIYSTSSGKNLESVTPGNNIVIENTTDGSVIQNLKIYGNSIQNGTPSPSTPVEIQSVGDYDATTKKYKIPITVSGKNLFNPKHNFNYNSSSYYSCYGLKIYLEDEDVYVINGTVTADIGTVTCASRIINIPNTKGSYYSLSTKYVSGTVTRPKETDTAIAYFGTGDSLSTHTNWYNVGLHNQDSKSENRQCNNNYINKLWFYISKGVTFNNYKVKIQLEKNSVATSYAKYNASNTTLYLDEPLRAIGDYKDYIDFEAKQIVRKVGTKEYSGTEDIKDWIYNSKIYGFYDSLSKALAPQLPLSTHFIQHSDKNSKPNGKNNAIVYDKEKVLYFGSDDWENSTNFKSWLKSQKDGGTPVTIYYQLNTPSYETRNDLPNVTMLGGTNMVYTNTNVKPTISFTN